MPPIGARGGARRRGLGFAALLVALELLVPDRAAAHAELLSSDPAANVALLAAPAAVTLEFSEPIDPSTATVQLLDEAGAPVAGIGSPSAERDAALLRVELPELEPGQYTVDYRVTSAVDGHVTSGRFAFLVDPTGTLPAPAVAPTSETPTTDLATIVTRWIALLALLVLAGTAIFWLAGRRTIGDLVGVPWAALAAIALVAFAAHAAYLTLAARAFLDPAGGHGGHGGLTGFPLDFAAPFGWTPFGAAMRIVLGATASVFVLASARAVWIDEARRGGRSPRVAIDRALLATVLAGGLLALGGASFAAHAAAYGGALSAAVDFLHLAAVASWLGALPGAALLAWQARGGRSRTGPSGRGVVSAALRGHGRVALAAAPIVALTGVANSPLVIGDARGLMDSGYGNLLIGKALLFSTALGLGSANFLLLREGSVRRAVAVLAAEGLVGVIAILLAASMVTLQPSAARAPTTAPSGIGTRHLYAEADGLKIHVGVNRPAPGPQRYQVSVADAATGAPRRDVQGVTLSFTPPASVAAEERRVELLLQADTAVWGAAGAFTPLVGEWLLEAEARMADGTTRSATFPLAVADATTPPTLPAPDTGVGIPGPLAVLYGLLPRGALGWLPALALLGGAASLALWTRNRRPPTWTARARTALVALAVVAGLAAGTRTLVEVANAPPPRAAAAVNPVAADAASIERGHRLYVANCTTCHGPNGTGDGPAASGMLPPPGELAAEVREATDGELAYRIAAGVAGTRMPPFAATLSEDDRWDLVNYLRTRWGRAD